MDTIIDTDAVNPILNEIMKAELAGVVRYTHYSLVITGPTRLPLVDFMKAQAAESLLHAQQVGEILTGLGGHPEQGIARIEESQITRSKRSFESRSVTSGGRWTCTATCSPWSRASRSTWRSSPAGRSARRSCT